MLGGFLYGYSQSQDLGQCLKTAVAAGSANCLSLQPGDINRSQVLALRKKVTLQRLR
jgi:fructose-1-phosphate kinase PfkB-like protein